ncbi:sulfurase [Actinoplanes octamycinicus]|nr:sulfurase [Actinoplanes octamycinicus]
MELLASPVHRFEGRPQDGPGAAPDGELVREVRVRAGMGIVGDRYFNHPAHRDASITVIARESLPAGVGLAQVRRNVLVAGLVVGERTVDDLVGSVLVLDSGDGPVRLAVRRAANPCAWMDVTVGPGAMKALRRRGGVRCVPLDDGVLRVGALVATVEAASVVP